MLMSPDQCTRIAYWLTHYALPTIARCSGGSPNCQLLRNKIQNTSRNTLLVSLVRGLLTYGGNEGCVEGVVREAEQHTGLPHARISD